MSENHVKDDYSYLKIDLTRPVLFLDLCGVLNNCLSSTFSWYPDKVERRWLRHDHVEGHKADLLFALLKHRNVQVIMVSSWVSAHLRHDAKDIDELRTFFGYEDIMGSVSTGGGPERGRSVLACVEWHGLHRWGVLDDSEQMYDLAALGLGRLFSPHGRYGLTDQLLERLDTEAFLEDPEEAFVPPTTR